MDIVKGCIKEKKMGKRIEFISFKEFQKLYKACKDPELKLAMLLGFGSGLRISEIIGLRNFESKCCNAKVRQEKVEEVENV